MCEIEIFDIKRNFYHDMQISGSALQTSKMRGIIHMEGLLEFHEDFEYFSHKTLPINASTAAKLIAPCICLNSDTRVILGWSTTSLMG